MKAITCFFAALLGLVASTASATNYKKVVGGDISMLTKYVQAGSTYYDDSGNQLTDAPAILSYMKGLGLNSMRVRLFVDPSKASSDDIGSGVCQDLDYVKTLGKQIKDAGLNFLLDLHYSDTWTDPGQHSTPSAWKSNDPTTLANYLYNYTKEVLNTLVAGGATPDDIQIGNEVTVGMLWPTGKCYANGQSVTTGNVTGTMDNFALYLAKGAKACREVCPNAKLIIHTELSSSGWGAKTLYTTLAGYADVDYDVIGLSYYPYYHGDLSVLEDVISSLESSCPTKEIQIVEAGYYYRYQTSSASYDLSSTYPISLDGQKKFTAALVDMLNNHSKVTGLYWWWLEANEYGKSTNVTTNWYYAGLWNNDTGYPCPALLTLPTFIDDEDNIVAESLDIKAHFINTVGWGKVNAYANIWDDNNGETLFTDSWPGTALATSSTITIDGTSANVFTWNAKGISDIADIPQQIQFNNDGWDTGDQTQMMGFLNGAYYRYYQSGSDYVSECYQLILPDGQGVNDHSTDFCCKKWVKPLHVGYLRQFTEGKLSTICLPFALDTEEVAAAGSIYQLSSYSDGLLTFSSVSYTQAYTPYLFKPARSGAIFADMGEKEIDVSTLADVTAGDATMTGVLVRSALASDDDRVVYGYRESDGVFVKANNANINPFRAYLYLPASASLSNSIDVTFDEVDHIASVTTPQADAVEEYSLTGQRVNDSYRGIVVVKGKKFLRK